MIIADRIRTLREEKKLSQEDVVRRTGLLSGYISRVENGHTVPSLETLEKMARALEVPLYQLFYDAEKPPELLHLPKPKTTEEIVWGSFGKGTPILTKLRRLLGRIEETDRRLAINQSGVAQSSEARLNPRVLLWVALACLAVAVLAFYLLFHGNTH